MSRRFFQESQRFNQWWIYLIIIVIFAFMLYDLVIELSNDGASVASNSFVFFVLAGVAFPLLFSMLGKNGNSNCQERIDLVNRFIEIFGKEIIKLMVSDREFVG